MIVKGINVPNDWIDEMTAKLDISLDEAVELYLTDVGAVENEEQNALNEKAKGVKIQHNADSAKPKKQVKRERKPNELKREIIAILYDILGECVLETAENPDFYDSLKIVNVEKYIDFTVDGRNFTINLVEHRPPKKK